MPRRDEDYARRRLAHLRQTAVAARDDHRSVARTPCTVTHDVGGLLAVIRGSADLARGKLEASHPANADLARIARSCEEMASLAMELRRLVCAPDTPGALVDLDRR
jgi:hypothetical protein